MKGSIGFSALGILVSALFFAGCQVSPEQVCDHLKRKDALPSGGLQCIDLMRRLEADTPKEWPDIAACFKTSINEEEISVCYRMARNTVVRGACTNAVELSVDNSVDPVTYAIPHGACVRDLQQLIATDTAWMPKVQCVLSARTFDAVRSCRALKTLEPIPVSIGEEAPPAQVDKVSEP